MTSEYSIPLAQLSEKFHLKLLTPGVSLEGREISNAEINRPALQLAGYYAYFDPARVQIIGKVEYSYLTTFSREQRRRIYERLFKTNISCLIFCRSLGDVLEPGIIETAEKCGTVLFGTDENTVNFTVMLIQYLSQELAPRTIIHGVMVDVFGEGVLIQGDSGLGKSETALELVQRGHRLVADDVVEIRRVSDKELIAHSVELLQNMIELRGVGVVNIKELYGVQSVRLSKSVDMIVRLEAWNPEKQYDRIGLETATTEILGGDVSLYQLPIMAGRNVAMIIETAALNHREKKMGYNAAEELRDRVNETIKKRKEQKS